ncbi:MAG: (2Fe-2S)-binding protein [Acidobacteria bacterium]|nr:(2Fe-2S)-binding protein [Acidobacteriota bacterium]
MSLTLTVNGVARRVDADPRTPLLWILRDTLGLCGTKYGCGNGICGACTVHLDGEAYRSCQVQVSDVGKKRVTTIEGLSPDGSHPCQRAWLEEDVSQCGYCQPGMLMATAALLREKPRPAEADVNRVLADHVCRCGTYQRIRAAVARAVETAAATPATKAGS